MTRAEIDKEVEKHMNDLEETINLVMDLGSGLDLEGIDEEELENILSQLFE